MRANKQIEIIENILNNVNNINISNIKIKNTYRRLFNNVYKSIYENYYDYMDSQKEAYRLKTDENKNRTKANYESKNKITKDLLNELNIFNKSNELNKNNIINLFKLFKIYSNKCCIDDDEEIIKFMNLFI